MKKFIKHYKRIKELWFEFDSGTQISASEYRFLKRKIPVVDIEEYIIHEKAKRLLCLR